MKYFVLSMIMLSSFTTMAQEIIEDRKEEKVVKKTIDPSKRMKLDGVAAVVGDYVVLDSDIDKQFEQIQAAGGSIEGITRCEMFGKLMEDKLYMHHSIQDSIVVNEAEVRSYVDQQINGMAQQIGSVEKLVAYYKKATEQELRDEMFEINKNGKMVQMMQQKIVEEIEITPEEVRQFFNSELKEDPPVFGTELKIAQIVVVPKPSEVETQKVIDRLKEFKADILDNGASFTTKAVLYSEDPGSRGKGGKYTLNRKQPRMHKEFRDVAFSLQEGEISEPFKTVNGYHIIFLEKIRGQEYDIRHILLAPKLTSEVIEAAKEKLAVTRKRIIDGELTFAEAALEVSDEKETKYEGGQYRHPQTQDFVIPLTRIDPEIYGQVQNLENEEISAVLEEKDLYNQTQYKIITVTDRFDEHKADFAKDYLKIKDLALKDKQLKLIGKWQEEKIMETFIKLNGEHRDCDFNANWLKKEN